ncbi:N-acetyltransferase [Hallerella porci]|uniref:N-acetyltransferase n=2 Tax=Fibrobacteraceae TaxID=204431 RepID=A0ABX5LJW1_9BACT|nr:N-acetyltransferase [Hallerella porci]
MQQEVLNLCESISHVTYENLTKIIRYSQAKSADGARRLDDCYENDLDAWMGGGTCFSLTWHLYRKLLEMGYSPKLLMGDKRIEKNIHCALLLPVDGEDFLLDPGYLIFDPLKIPAAIPFQIAQVFYPLKPNVVRLDLENGVLGLFTGSLKGPLKLRFTFDIRGVSPQEFQRHWSESFDREMMTYPVLNKLDREKGIQYYYQKGNLLIRDENGSRMKKIAPENQVEKIHEIFGMDKETVERALGSLRSQGNL